MFETNSHYLKNIQDKGPGNLYPKYNTKTSKRIIKDPQNNKDSETTYYYGYDNDKDIDQIWNTNEDPYNISSIAMTNTNKIKKSEYTRMVEELKMSVLSFLIYVISLFEMFIDKFISISKEAFFCACFFLSKGYSSFVGVIKEMSKNIILGIRINKMKRLILSPLRLVEAIVFGILRYLFGVFPKDSSILVISLNFVSYGLSFFLFLIVMSMIEKDYPRFFLFLLIGFIHFMVRAGGLGYSCIGWSENNKTKK